MTAVTSRKPLLLSALAVGVLVVIGYFVILRDEPATAGRQVRIETTEGACWSATLPIEPTRPDLPFEEQGCASVVLSVVGSGPVVVTKTTAPGNLTVTALFDEKPIEVATTSDPSGSVTVTPVQPK